MARGELGKMAAVLGLGVALALPAGFVIGRLGTDDTPAQPARPADRAVRDVFSPSLRRDPYFLERQREGVEALERHCARTGETCAEARAARRRLAELDAAD